MSIVDLRKERGDALAALAIAGTLAALWTLRTWSDISALRLPDPDDMMRLQQIRDWLGGQPFADLTQYRLGAEGVPMHWSRIADLVPAAIILTLQGIVGRHAAEVTAVLAWPALLLTADVWLSGRIAGLIAGPEASWRAMVVAAAAFPATTAFAPGRIDHHGLQLVLLLVTTVALVGGPTFRAGVTGGLATVLSLAVGVELAPLLAVAATIVVAEWVLSREGARQRLVGFGLSLLLGTAAAGMLLRSAAWYYPACDGFTAVSFRVMLIGSLAPLTLALLPSRCGRNVRWAAALLLGGAIAAAVATGAPQCLSPYGNVPAALQRLWLSRVTEAQPLLAAPVGLAIAHCGLMFMGLSVSLWQAAKTRQRGWILLTLLQLSAAAVTLIQLRGSFPGALLAAPALGSLLASARRRGALATVGAWVASGGLFYPVAAKALPAVRDTGVSPASSCTAPDLIAALDRLQPGTVMAPIDTAAPAILATQHRLIAGAYHRDGPGNLAMYSFFLGDAANAQHVANNWQVRWVVACDGFGGVAAPFSRRLQEGKVPAWLRPVAHVESGARIFEVAAAER